MRGVGLTGFNLGRGLAKRTPEQVRAIYADLAAKIRDGVLKAPVDSSYPIEDIKAALIRCAAGRPATARCWCCRTGRCDPAKVGTSFEAATRTTHPVIPAQAGIQGFQSLAPCSSQGQALGPRFRGGDKSASRRKFSHALRGSPLEATHAAASRYNGGYRSISTFGYSLESQ